MKAFISYSHNDTPMLETLHKHLKQLQRDGLIRTWEDREINAGGHLDRNISRALETSQLFLGLLSPDYIASEYCYEKEFKKALEMQDDGSLIIVPIVLEPCDWLNTPFNKFKALPKDGKAISTWQNQNTAFLDVTQNLRRLVDSPISASQEKFTSGFSSHNYRVKKHFDSIERLELVEKTFQQIKDYLKSYIGEIQQLDKIKVRILIDNDKEFNSLLVNRNMIDTESQLTITTVSENANRGFNLSEDYVINYKIGKSNNLPSNRFKIQHDEFQLFWTHDDYSFRIIDKKQLSSKEIADIIWKEWLETVGIL